jgi:hypothetical protein
VPRGDRALELPQDPSWPSLPTSCARR